MVYKIDEEKRLVVLLEVGPRKAILAYYQNSLESEIPLR